MKLFVTGVYDQIGTPTYWDKSKLVENGFTPLPTWRNALQRYLVALEEGRID